MNWYLIKQSQTVHSPLQVQTFPHLKIHHYTINTCTQGLPHNCSPRGVLFSPRALARGKTISQGWTIMMFTLSAGINCFIILKLYFFCITLISFDKCEHFCKWTARLVPLGTPAVAILYILTSHTRFRSWSFYWYRKRFGDLDHCFPGHQEKTDDSEIL